MSGSLSACNLAAVREKDAPFSEQPFSFDKADRQDSVGSDAVSTTVEGFNSWETHSRQCSEIDKALLESVVENTLRRIVAECNFCITIADPRQADFPLIAVSDQFEAVSGYLREEILGKNCRFLNQGCEMQPMCIAGLRDACATGAPFSSVLVNRRKSGQLFENLLDLRGLTVAQNPSSNEQLWFLIGIQADVTNITDNDRPENHMSKFHQVSEAVRTKLAHELSVMALTESIAGRRETKKPLNTWVVLKDPTWRSSGGATESREILPQRKLTLPLASGIAALFVTLALCAALRHRS